MGSQCPAAWLGAIVYQANELGQDADGQGMATLVIDEFRIYLFRGEKTLGRGIVPSSRLNF